jgi:uncharacterized membrane protein YGL010W
MRTDVPLQHPAQGLFGSAMDLLVAYARQHRDKRNIQMHLVAVPLAWLALAVFLRGPTGIPIDASVTPAWGLLGLVMGWYLTRGQFRLGVATSALLAAVFFAAHQLPQGGLLHWLGWAAGLMAMGSLLQWAGHYYEGQRPASWVHPVHLLVGPMFVSTVLLGGTAFLRSLNAEVLRRAGPVHVRDLAHPMPTR